MTFLKLGAVALAAMVFPLGAFAQQPDTCGADLKGATRADSARYTVAYVAQPAPIAVSKHFSLEFAICAKTGAPAADALRVDARMPEHGHGMNYKPTIKALGHGRFQANGLMFHMPGRWEFVFDVHGGGTSERVLGKFTLR